jgi:hypothetical protein
MQKLIERIGTESHKYRMLLQFTRILIMPKTEQPQQNSTYYRIVLQRDNKKYSSNYVKLRAGK